MTEPRQVPVHKPRFQNGMGGKFIVCSCDDWRSGVGDQAYIRQQFADHLRLMKPPTDPFLRSVDA